MKKAKILLDILMTITLVSVMLTYLTGIQIHEILGILFVVEFTIHKLINIKSILMFSKQIINKKANRFVTWTIATDIILVVFMLVSCISGIIISRYLFDFNINYEVFWTITHYITSYISAVIILIHALIHTKQIVMGINNMIGTKYKKMHEYIFGSFILVLAILLVKLFVKNEVINKIKVMYQSDKNKTEISDSIDKIDTNTTNTIDDENNDEDKNKSSANVTQTPTAVEITNYLSKLRCDGCGKNCILTNPRCIVGERQQEETTAQYIKDYSSGI